MNRASEDTRQHSRSPRGPRGWFNSKGKEGTRADKPAEKPEDKMHKWALSSGSDASRVKELMDTMQVADFEKKKMVAVFKCPRDKVSEKIRNEFVAKKFPEEVITAVIEGMGGLSFYEKNDSHFEHSSKASEKGKSQLYQYAVWCELDEQSLMDVSVWCITTHFKKGSQGAATRNEIDGLKEFMEQETRADVLHIAHGPKMLTNRTMAGNATIATPEQNMIEYAKTVHASRKAETTLHEDELINRMEITSFEKYKTSSSFKCPKDGVVSKVKSELEAKKFPQDAIQAVTEGMADMLIYKKMDENFGVTCHDGRSSFQKYAIWCAADEDGEMKVSMFCVAANFKKKSNGPATKSEIEVLGHYLGQEACADILKVHAPAALQ